MQKSFYQRRIVSTMSFGKGCYHKGAVHLPQSSILAAINDEYDAHTWPDMAMKGKVECYTVMHFSLLLQFNSL